VDPLPLLILVKGALPGLGKSTLSRGLAARLRDGGLDVEEFEEQAILDRPEFAAAIGEWRSTSRVSFETLLVGTHAYLEACRRRRADVYVVDSLLPFLPSLFAWGRSDGEIRGFFSELRALMRGFEVLLLQLEGDATTGLQRAAGREAEGWLPRFVAKVHDYEDDGRTTRDFESVVAYLESAASRSRKLLSRAPWRVWFVQVEQDCELVLDLVMSSLGGSGASCLAEPSKLSRNPARRSGAGIGAVRTPTIAVYERRRAGRLRQAVS
jgi:hypothetical protein